jgi:hypothetical protein
MLRPISEQEFQRAEITIFARDGRVYRNMDMLPNGFEVEGLVMFWHNDGVIGLPVSEVERMEMIFPDRNHEAEL